MNRGLDLIGRQIGVYRIEELIGAGGYSRVYRGLDKTVGRSAAIKMLLPSAENEGYADPVIQRFEREARIVANLRDPHSVLLYEYGQTDDGLLYMIFEYIEGHTLEEIRRQQFALPALRVVKILEQILLSLEEAHALGLIHRDIKPANIMLFEHIGRTDQVKVLDFGVGKATDGHAESKDLTQTGMLIGTPRYMAPEQWSTDGEISPQTDIYSLGLVTYELLTGARAITASDPVHIMRAHLDRHPIRLPVDLDIPSGLRQVVNTMLHKDRSRRYASVRDVLADLMRLKPMGAESNTMILDEAKLRSTREEADRQRPARAEDSEDADEAPLRCAKKTIRLPPEALLTHTSERPVLEEDESAAAIMPEEVDAAVFLDPPKRPSRGVVAFMVLISFFVGGYALFLALSPPKSPQISAPSTPETPAQNEAEPSQHESLAAASTTLQKASETEPEKLAVPTRMGPPEIASEVRATSKSHRDAEKSPQPAPKKPSATPNAPAASPEKPRKRPNGATKTAKKPANEPKLQIWGIE